MLEAVRKADDPRRLYCTACFTGKYPMVNDDAETAAAITAQGTGNGRQVMIAGDLSPVAL